VLVLALLSSTGRAQARSPRPPIAAKAYVLVDVLSGQTLAAAGENDRAEPASLTKVMTAYVVFAAMRDGKLEPARSVHGFREGRQAAGSRMFLTEGKPATWTSWCAAWPWTPATIAAIALAEAGRRGARRPSSRS
jgi:D-alanyl-D-alanine carboxypeptidase (penicillin-binding protein 5/6)